MMKNIRIVLINTSHPGNIGSAARAMKTMGLERLYLVNPKFFPHGQATALASNAADVLENATVVDSLDAAIQDCGLVIGTSARTRMLLWSSFSAEKAALKIKVAADQNTQVAIVFGREDSGLTNDEIKRCHCQVFIPSNPEYSSLNLSAAVQVIGYEIYKAFADHVEPVQPVGDVLATAQDIEHFYKHLERVLIEVEFLKVTRSTQIMNRLRRIFNRVSLEAKEVKILRGVLTAVGKKIK